MILADTSVWIDHFRRADPALNELLTKQRILSHPFVIGELAMGSLKDRSLVIGNLSKLPKAVTASESEVLSLIERFKIFARGIGYIDAHLLASVLLTSEASLWTRDRTLHMVAGQFGASAKLPGTSFQ